MENKPPSSPVAFAPVPIPAQADDEHTELVWPHDDPHACFVRCLRCGWCSMPFLSVDVALEVAQRHESGVAMPDCRPRGKGDGAARVACTAPAANALPDAPLSTPPAQKGTPDLAAPGSDNAAGAAGTTGPTS